MKLPHIKKSLSVLSLLVASSALADTTLTFDTLPAGQSHNTSIIQTFGDNASSSSAGVVVTGIGTPNINLTWSAVSATANASTRWDYYIEGPWAAGQLNRSQVNDYHDLKLTPSGGAVVVVKSLKFHGYYDTSGPVGVERFTYNWDVLDALSQSSLTNGQISFISDATKNHPVDIGYVGTSGQELILRLTRVASTLTGVEVEGDSADIAVDDIVFSQQIGSATPVVASVSPANGDTSVSPTFDYRATIVDGFTTQLVTNSIKLSLDGILVSPIITKTGLTTTVAFAAGGLIRGGTTNVYALTFNDTAATGYTNTSTFLVQPYSSYEWRFTAGDLGTAIGNGFMDYSDAESGTLTQFGTTDGGAIPHVAGVPTKYMHVPAFANQGNGYYLTFNDMAPNGGGDYVNRYAFICDFLLPGTFDWTPFFNTNPNNPGGNDADFYISPDADIGIGALGYSATDVISLNTWYRLIFTIDCASGNTAYYLNGSSIFSGTISGLLDGRFALLSNLDPGPDLLLFNEGDTSGQYTHEIYVASIAFTDRTISAPEAAALGAPNPSGILAPSQTPRPTLNLQKSGSNIQVSWPSNYVGYALQRASTVVDSNWLPVPGITNNTVTLTPSSGPQFFRLVQ